MPTTIGHFDLALVNLCFAENLLTLYLATSAIALAWNTTPLATQKLKPIMKMQWIATTMSSKLELINYSIELWICRKLNDGLKRNNYIKIATSTMPFCRKCFGRVKICTAYPICICQKHKMTFDQIRVKWSSTVYAKIMRRKYHMMLNIGSLNILIKTRYKIWILPTEVHST